jgi:putative colanic acid biosynthesis acetyltransferase WcaF
VVNKPRVNVHFPGRLEVGAHSWIGEEVFILNFDPVRIGTQACVSQRAFLCTGNHDFRDEKFSFRSAPISVGDGAGVGASVFVGPGVEIGAEAVVTAGSVVLKSLAAGRICSGNPAVAGSARWKDGSAV